MKKHDCEQWRLEGVGCAKCQHEWEKDLNLRRAAEEFFKAIDEQAKFMPADPLGEWDTGDVEADMEAGMLVEEKKAALRAALEAK